MKFREEEDVLLEAINSSKTLEGLTTIQILCFEIKASEIIDRESKRYAPCAGSELREGC